MSDCVPPVREFHRRWKILSVRPDQRFFRLVLGSCKDTQMFRCSDFTSNNLGQNLGNKNYHTTPGLVPFQLSVVIFVVSSAFEAKTLPENSLILSSEPLICGTIYEGVYGASQVKQKALC